ncbi:hypothetical protein AO1008_08954 [Aspergillus oryzae 100-8]|nr:hypothetical protein AO1008_08954 [Aspergillus oryzae 100-8]
MLQSDLIKSLTEECAYLESRLAELESLEQHSPDKGCNLFDPVAIGSYCSHCSACRPNAVVYLIFPILPSFSFLSLSLSLYLFSILSPSHLDPFD